MFWTSTLNCSAAISTSPSDLNGTAPAAIVIAGIVITKSGPRGGATLVDSKVVPPSGDVRNQPERTAPDDSAELMPGLPSDRNRSYQIPWPKFELLKTPDDPPTDEAVTAALPGSPAQWSAARPP